MRGGWIFIFILLLVGRGMAQSTDVLRECWNRKGVNHAAVGVSVKNTANGDVVYESNAGMALRPASVLKLLSTTLALKKEGDSLTYRTKVFYTGHIKDTTLCGDIVIRAGGDPCLDSKYFKDASFMSRIVDTLVSLGIKRVSGKLVIEDDGVRPLIPGSWPWEDVANYYAALYHPFNYRDNTYTLTLSSGKTGASTKIVSVIPSVPGVKWHNEVVASSKQQDDAWIYGGPEASTLTVRGTIPANRKSFAVKGAMHRPATVFQAELVRKLNDKGIVLENKPVESGEHQHLLTHVSPLLKDIVYYTNKNSVNLFAEALGALVSLSDFEKSVKEELTGIGVDSSGIIIKDACGLSPTNALPAAVFTDLLVWAKEHLSNTFMQSLPRGGTDWGLRIYADDPVLKGNVRAKTGSMFGVRALSGYLHTQKGQVLAFTILVNNYTGDPLTIQRYVRDFLRELAKS